MREGVAFTHRQRSILRYWIAGRDSKRIAYDLELSVPAVNSILLAAANKMGVTRQEIKTWMMQHPSCLDRGAVCERGLHPPECGCPSLYCTMMRRAA